MSRIVKPTWIAMSAALALAAAASGQTSVFTYQGVLRTNGTPATATFDLQFRLFDSELGGVQQGSTICADNVSVAAGLFSVPLDFGVSPFTGANRWVQIGVRSDNTAGNCGAGVYTNLATRQQVTSTPYAIESRGLTLPFAGSANASGNAVAVSNSSDGGTSLYGIHTSSAGIAPAIFGETLSTASSALGILGVVTSTAPGGFSAAVRGMNNGTGGLGIGVYGSQAGSGWGGYFTAGSSGIGVNTSAGTGGYGLNAGGGSRGVRGTATDTTGEVFGVEGLVDSTTGEAAGVRGANSATVGSAYGVLGEITSTTPGGFSAAVRGINAGTGGLGIGVHGSQAGSGWGGYFTAGTGGIGVNTSVSAGGTGVLGSGGARGVRGFANDSTGVVFGVEGSVSSPISESAGVHGTNSGTISQAYGVLGEITSTAPGGSSSGVRGKNLGTGGLGIGVWGSQEGTGWGVEGSVTGAGTGVIGFAPSTGNAIRAVGNSTASGTKAFCIDHPSDPANKYLQHFCAEGPEPLNIYRGSVVTDGYGSAWITLPEYFERINRDPHVQLTVSDVNDFALVRVATEVANNRFQIKSNRANVKVFWRVEAVRNDAWVRAHGAPVEVAKPAHEKGTFLHPELFGFGPERGLQNRMENGAAARGRP